MFWQCLQAVIQDGWNEFIVVGHFTVKVRFVVCGLHTKIVYDKRLHMSQGAYQVRTYPGFCSMKRLEMFLLPPGWDASPSRGYPHIKFVSSQGCQ